MNPETFHLDIELPAALSTAAECEIARKAVAASPGSAELRFRLAYLLYILDEFDEAVSLLVPIAGDGAAFKVLHILALTYLSRETPQDDVAAAAAAERALAVAASGVERGRALATLGKTHRRRSDIPSARAAFSASLDADPANKDACKRLMSLEMETGHPHAVLEIADRLAEHGVGHSRLLVARALSQAQLGSIEEARESVGFDHFLYRERLTAPAGWATIEDFNRDLETELAGHPALRFDRYGTASFRTWRVDQPATASSRMVPVLQRIIQSAASAYVDGLPAAGHPWLHARPSRALLHNWCVMTHGEGHEEWHVHQHGWLSGVYYVSVPPGRPEGDGREGCIAFGLPADIVGADKAALYGETLIRPEAGLLMLFPSHSYHRTFAHKAEARRICFAFDIKPN